MYRNLSDPPTSLFLDGQDIAEVLSTLTTFNDVDSHAANNDDIYVMLRSATVGDSETVLWRMGNSDGMSLNYEQRVAFGICVSAPETSGNTLYEYAIAAYSGKYTTTNIEYLSLQPFIGQLKATAPVAWNGNGTTRQNQTTYHLLPSQDKGLLYVSSQGRVLVGRNLGVDTSTTAQGNPLVFGVIVRSDSDMTNGATTFQDMDFSVSAFKITEPTEINGEFPSSDLICV